MNESEKVKQKSLGDQESLEESNGQFERMSSSSNGENNNNGYALTPVQSDPIIPITAINSMVANNIGETRATIEPSVESTVQNKQPKPKMMVEINSFDWKILCVILSFISLLTLISFGLSFSSITRKESNLSMERSSYWWYFLFSLLILVVTLYLYLGLMGQPQIHKTSLLWYLLMALIILMIELILITRFFFVTFPMTDLNWNLEPIVFIGVSSLRFISYLVLISYIIKYLNAISSNSSKSSKKQNHKHLENGPKKE